MSGLQVKGLVDIFPPLIKLMRNCLCPASILITADHARERQTHSCLAEHHCPLMACSRNCTHVLLCYKETNGVSFVDATVYTNLYLLLLFYRTTWLILSMPETYPLSLSRLAPCLGTSKSSMNSTGKIPP